MNKSKQEATDLKRVVATSAKELAEKLSLSTRTIWRLLSAGKLPSPVSVGGSRRFLMTDVNLFLECNCDMKRFKATKKTDNEH